MPLIWTSSLVTSERELRNRSGVIPCGGRTACDRLLRIRQQERSVFGAQEPGRVKRLQFFLFADAFETLADIDESGNRRIARSQQSGDPCADVRCGNGLRRNVSGMPMVLMPRMQDVAQVGQHVRTNQRAAIHDCEPCSPGPASVLMLSTTVSMAGKVLMIFSDRRADFERLVTFGVERIGSRHAAGHPQQDARCRPWPSKDACPLLGRIRTGRTASQCGQRRGVAAAVFCMNSRRVSKG